ncbi:MULTISPECIES: DUF2018 family protein [unclassified Sulfuricurvum]|uniref:DUF2018 family protein n=1 Tax=unclassified Sulfuricurvum TaxID=2632390 RepID=UPI0002999913|nr:MULTISPECIES: DUF2018 family protein [unclassified Sulfuricurvum]OHD80310.1 MAG: hypothetical protein A3D90_02880 [Sulfuricurvum sp. RIFCSPHIGHO2_02_FULL_43_9]OHD85535.1 MAG: hypothetical protein A3I60_01115 [Sulfuricurvum sp. RIFCSPLOWO2_02_FULL_43_45]OHD89227.1 MAG: hypothetical protein A3J39_09210 [Sulfuricurvum sp. RIFCSPHIGHO2_12_FULL_44_8]AFV97117.1 hypothetical protein B649_04015 [Candidatus Sulfuricurvum sp. RIFRC-1]OHD88853.1 MAG: hypothetical protein A3G19_07345 [Sulfuricurvum sp.
MASYDALFEDEDDIFGGTPESKYWDIVKQVSTDIARYEFDTMIAKMAAMEQMLMEKYDEESLDKVIDRHICSNESAIENRKKSLYMEYAGRLIYKLSD